MPRKTSTTKAEGQAAPAASIESKLPPEQQQATALQYIEGRLAGVQLHDGTVVSLAELPEADLRKIAMDMEIDAADTLALDQLVVAIQAEPVLVDKGDGLSGAGAGGDVLPHIACEDDRYQVLLTDGSLAYLEELPKEDLAALAGACLRLAPFGLAGAQIIGMDLAGDDGVRVLHGRAGGSDRYVVRREQLSHNGLSYTHGDSIQFDDDEHALQLLAIGAIAPEVL